MGEVVELKTKYQYTYFIYPYLVDEKKYDKYILKLFKNKKCKFQIFEKEISTLSDEDKMNFPVCQYYPDHEIIKGIFSSEAEFRKYRNTMELSVYKRDNGPQFVIYSWNVFSTLVFVKECLKRFGNPGDKFVLVYRDKTEQELNQNKK